MTNIDYTLWPNADGELGKIKVAIPTNAEDWPAGDALIGNFVYNDGKLAGFIDTKALILNESATTTFPYDYVDISLPSIQEGTLTINRGERCKYLNVKMYRADWLPAGFTELEYLESSGTQYLLINEPFTKGSGVSVDVHLTDSRLAQNGYYLYIYTLLYNTEYRIFAGPNGTANRIANEEYGNHGKHQSAYSSDGRYSAEYNFRNSEQMVLTTTSETKTNAITAGYIKDTSKFSLFGSWREDTGVASPRSCTQRLYFARLSQGTAITRDLIPALRNSDGVAGVWDTVNKQFYTNEGSGTFGYRIKFTNSDITPLSLRDPYYVAPSGVYAKLIADNTLDIIADTEFNENEKEGYTWFANASEAEIHFGIIHKEPI